MDASGRALSVFFDQTISAIEPAAKGDVGLLLTPGFLDVQVNGFAGVDFNSPQTSHEQIAYATRVIRQTGVTRYFPTVITGDPEKMGASLRNLANAREAIAERASIEAFHVEGPHICERDGPRGAHPREWVCEPDIDLFHRLQDAAQGHIRLTTVSPHWSGAPRYIEAVVKTGVVVSLGHTDANAQQIDDCVRAGATMSTHIGNGADSVMRRHPNYLWDQLADDRLMAGLIVDGIHLGQAFLKVAVRAKGVERSVLVTDASTPAGCAPGRYRLGQQDVDLREDGSVVLAGQDRLAGSALKMNDAVLKVMQLAGVSLADAVQMASVNPAKACRIEGHQNGLAVGDVADLVLFENEGGRLEAKQMWIDGEPVTL